MRSLVLAFAALPLIGGCGLTDLVAEQIADPPTPTETVTVTSEPSPTADGLSKPSPRSAGPEPSRVERTYDASQYGSAAFVSPSGNIGCWMQTDEVRCDIVEMSFAPPPPPSTCGFEFGHTMVLTSSQAAFGCSSEPILPMADTNVGASGGPTAWREQGPENPVVSVQGQQLAGLAYGNSIRFARFVCTSTESGVTCENTTGRGFALARSAYSLY